MYDREVCMHHQNSERARAEHQRLNNELNLNRRDDLKMEPKRNLKGQTLLSADMTLLGDDEFAGKQGNGQKKNKGKCPLAFEGYLPEAPVQQAEYVCIAPFNNDNQGRGSTQAQRGYSSAHMVSVRRSSVGMTISSLGGANISRLVLATITTIVARHAVGTISLTSSISAVILGIIEAATIEADMAIIQTTPSEDTM